MKRLGGRGVRRGEVVRTTAHDIRPNQLWVSDFTNVSTWQGWLYAASVIYVYPLARPVRPAPCAQIA